MAESVMTVAYDSGVNLFDTAEVYASGRYSTNCLSACLTSLREYPSTFQQDKDKRFPRGCCRADGGGVLWRVKKLSPFSESESDQT